MRVKDAINEFLTACKADGLAAATRRWYKSLLNHYAAVHGDLQIPHVKAVLIRHYIGDLRDSSYSADTIHGHIRALHRFWSWCSREYKLENPMANIRYPKQPRPEASKAADHDDVDKLLAVCGSGPTSRRDRAIIAFLVDTGCRAAGLTGLKWSDVDFPRRRAYVTEKGAKRRAVHFGVETRAYLTDLYYGRDPRAKTVFYNVRTGAPLTTSGLYQLLRRLAGKAKIPGRANPHSWRHAFGKAFIVDGGDSTTLAKLLGHEDVNVTAGYYAVFNEDEIGKLYAPHAPMSKIAKSKRSS